MRRTQSIVGGRGHVKVIFKVMALALTVVVLFTTLVPLARTASAASANANGAASAQALDSATPTPTVPTTTIACNLYPIALHTSSLAGVPINGSIGDIYNGGSPGNFGWLSWTGDVREPTLATSLTPPGNSATYVNPDGPADHVLSTNDWVDARPGVVSSKGVRDALTQLQGASITVPVWDQTAGTGSVSEYHVVGFATVRITAFQLLGVNRITAQYLGNAQCGTVMLPPPTPTPTPQPTDTPTPQPTSTPTAAPTATPTPAPTDTPTPQPTATPTPAPTDTPTPAPTATATPEPTATPTPAPTATPTPAPTDTPTPQPTDTPTPAPTSTPTPAPTDTPTPPPTPTSPPTATVPAGPSLDGASLTLAPSAAGPNVTGTTQTLTATLKDRTGAPMSGVAVQFAVTGTNATTGGGTTNDQGVVAFNYAGSAQGNDSVQATASSGGTELSSNTATVGWVTPQQQVSTTTIWGRFYYAGITTCNFTADPTQPAVFSEPFPTLDFNPPAGTVPGAPSSVNENARPMVDVTTDINGNFTGAIPAQGYDTQGHFLQAGVDGNPGMASFDAVFTGAFTVANAGSVTFDLYTDDGFILGVGDDAVSLGGTMVNPPANGLTPAESLPVMGAYNQASGASAKSVTVQFPAAGSYPFELDYTECLLGPLVVTVSINTASGDLGVAPTGSLALTPNSVPAQTAGTPISFTVAATDASGAALSNLPVTFNVSGPEPQQLQATTDATGSATFTYTDNAYGTDTVQAVAWISDMPSYSGQVTVQWNPPPTLPPTPPLVTQGWIGSPLNDSDVSGLVPITLTNNGPIQLCGSCGAVDYWPADNPSDVTALPTHTGVASGQLLATLDTTTLPNGAYIVRLRGSIITGDPITSEVLVNVVGENKPGRVTFSVTDLTVPVTGLPITIGRTYDSLNRGSVGDFGNGWQLTLGSPKLEVNPAHDVTLTLADGRRVTFAFTPQSTGGLFGYLLTPGYTPEPGVYGSLTADGCSLLVVSAGQYDCLFDAAYAPTTYKYTDPYGRVYVMGADGTLKSITDLNGNTLTFTPNGITSSAGNLNVPFVRDSQGRITQITDPAGKVYQYSYDSNGNLQDVALPGETTPITYSYDSTHSLLKELDPRGNTAAASTYYPDGRLESVTDAALNTTSYSYDLTTNTTTITAPDTGVTTQTYDNYGMVTSQTDPLSRTTTYTYDTNHKLTLVADPFGHTTSYTYDSQGNPTSITDPLGKSSSATYNLFGGPTTLTDAAGTIWTVGYDASFRPTSVGDSLGTLGGYTWDDHGNPMSRTDANGNITTFAYDPYGNVQSETDALLHSTSYTYDPLGRKLTSKDANQNTTTYTYDALGHLLTVTTPPTSGQTHVTTYTYDANGNQTSVTDANGHTTTYTYDAANRVQQVTYPDGTTTQYTYDFRGNVLTETDQAGHVTKNVYDLAGELTSVTTAYGTPDAATTTYQYDAAGRKIAETDPDGNTTQYGYDKAGHLLSVTDPYGHATSYKYDADGRQIAMTDANSHTTNYAYDIRGRLLTTTYPDTTTAQQSYDGNGNVLTSTDQDGHVTTYSYSAVNQLLSVQDPVQQTLQQQTSYAYDPNGNLLSITDANGHTTSFAYDALNRQIKKTWPDTTSVELFGYDAVGNQTSHQLADGHTNTSSYDNMDRLQQLNYFDGTSVSYTYTPTGQQQTVVDSRGTTTYGYDNQDRVTAITQPDGQSITYGYDLAGNRASITTAVGTTTASSTTYGYDQDNRLTSINATNAGTISIGYDNAGNQTQRVLPNGITVNTGYDQLNRLTSVTWIAGSSTLGSYAYTLDPAGNRTKVTETDGTTVQWGYDATSRLTSETQTTPSGQVAAQTSYTYDGVGNRLTMTSGGLTTQYSYNALDQLTSASAGSATAQYTYDGRGNLVEVTSGTGSSAGSSTTSYSYDAADRLVGVSSSAGTSVSYGYDAAGRQVSETSGGSTTNYLWDEQSPNGDIVLETDGSGNVQASYALDGRGTLLAETRGSGSGATTSYVLPDAQGSVRALASSSGSITDTYRYDAFGNLLSSTGTTPNPYLYDGQRFDAPSGLYQLRAREYDPIAGRFLSQDTAGFSLSSPLDLNRYAYAGNNPINAFDPTGHDSLLTEGLAAQQAESVAAAAWTAWTPTAAEAAATGVTEITGNMVAVRIGEVLLAVAAVIVETLLVQNPQGMPAPNPGPNPGPTPEPGPQPLPGPGGGPQPPTGIDDSDSTVTFFRGTTYYDALRDEEEGFSAKILEQRQRGRDMTPGLYTSRNPDVARWFAYYNAYEYPGQGGAALETITLKQSVFEDIAATFGVIDNRPLVGIPDYVAQPHVETVFPYDSLPALNASAVVTVEQLPLP